MDTISRAKRSSLMRKIKSRDTKLEKDIQRSLKLHKVYFAVNIKTIFGKPDIVFRKKKILVFIDSCFWHGCPKHCRLPSARRSYWVNKINRNKSRDKEVNRILKKEDWKVFRFWEHNLKRNHDSCLKKILLALKNN